jgi:hypothetical protein
MAAVNGDLSQLACAIACQVHSAAPARECRFARRVSRKVERLAGAAPHVDGRGRIRWRRLDGLAALVGSAATCYRSGGGELVLVKLEQVVGRRQ